jgi:hypothetical protein
VLASKVAIGFGVDKRTQALRNHHLLHDQTIHHLQVEIVPCIPELAPPLSIHTVRQQLDRSDISRLATDSISAWSVVK